MVLTLTLVATLVTAADLSGDWTIDGDVQGNPVEASSRSGLCGARQMIGTLP